MFLAIKLKSLIDRYHAAWTNKIDIKPVEHSAALIWCGCNAKLAEERVKDDQSFSGKTTIRISDTIPTTMCGKKLQVPR